ncbi:MAG: 3-hydroxyacyl-ACP dehydratase [Marinilabiliales bacterium]|nr:MAG: 3-hydroxyacyl-ACP dehydratase [Marinilabiliales bacterium]
MPKSEITSIIPQRPPFVMIDELVHVAENRTETSMQIREDNVFVEHGVFLEPGLIENIAQTAAACAGYVSLSKGKDAPVGYIGAVRKLQIDGLPKLGQKINTEITIEHRIAEVSVITGKVWCDGEKLAECEMKIFEKVDD